MNDKKYILSLLIVILFNIPAVLAQKATEVYIPIGKSPGLSGEFTTIGNVQSVDEEQYTLTVVDSGDTITVSITGETKVYLDKSQLNEQSVKGAWQDCLPGRRVEVKYKDNEYKEDAIAEWIKVEME